MKARSVMGLVAAILMATTGSLSIGQQTSTAQPFDPSSAVAVGPIILTVEGAIENAGPDGAIHLDRAMMESIGTVTIETRTPFTEGLVEFTGVLMRDLMTTVEAHGEHVVAIALNDYSYTIPLSDFTEGHVILAMDMNGTPMRVRDKGPIWIVYPEHEFDASLDHVRSAMVWQLRTLRFE